MSDFFTISFLENDGKITQAGFKLLKALVNETSESCMCYLFFNDSGHLTITIEYGEYLIDVIDLLIKYELSYAIVEAKVFICDNSLYVGILSSKQLKDLKNLINTINECKCKK